MWKDLTSAVSSSRFCVDDEDDDGHCTAVIVVANPNYTSSTTTCTSAMVEVGLLSSSYLTPCSWPTRNVIESLLHNVTIVLNGHATLKASKGIGILPSKHFLAVGPF
jgi:hypothetical protein